MLPFLHAKRIATTIMQKRAADGSSKIETSEDEQSPQLMQHSTDLIRAVHAKDAAKTAQVLQDIHEHLAGSGSTNLKGPAGDLG